MLGHSITYRIAVGLNEGRKAFTLQTVPPALEAPAGDERLCRYIARPAVATGRLALTAQGLVRYTLKTPYRDGATEPIDSQGRGRGGNGVPQQVVFLEK